eukprot:TRINITY_DN10007_c0_g1_i4.p1 TRINITY_DN10007_c0_g1~~TRINITY_DN10007_c0_g1_i4.p1  ORF type:complete len:291 (+),score=65.13 TRINITY_DN10007_c0_g1_i4:59-931(+)
MMRRPPRSTLSSSSAASDVYKRQGEERTRLILEQVAGAVRHVHGMGIIHRDINPKNVLMVQEPRGQPEWNERAVLLDFGQSIVLPEAGVHLSVCYQSGGGFLGYRAPEIVLQGFEHSYPVDLFSIGCLLHLMLTGQPPFLSEYAEKEQTRVAFNSPDCSEEAKSLLESLLQPDQHTRATVGDLVQSEWLSSGDDWEMVESAVRNTAHETVAAYEWETKVFGDWNWGTLTKNHWEVDPGMKQPDSDDTNEPDLEPPEGCEWDGEWVAGDWTVNTLGLVRQRTWLRRAVIVR